MAAFPSSAYDASRGVVVEQNVWLQARSGEVLWHELTMESVVVNVLGAPTGWAPRRVGF